MKYNSYDKNINNTYHNFFGFLEVPKYVINNNKDYIHEDKNIYFDDNKICNAININTNSTIDYTIDDVMYNGIPYDKYAEYFFNTTDLNDVNIKLDIGVYMIIFILIYHKKKNIFINNNLICHILIKLKKISYIIDKDNLGELIDDIKVLSNTEIINKYVKFNKYI